MNYPNPTKDSLFALSRMIALLFQSDKEVIMILITKDLIFQSGNRFIIIPLSHGCFTIPIRQRILHYSSLTGFLHYSNPTRDSLLFLSQEICSIFQSDKGFFIIALSKRFFTILLPRPRLPRLLLPRLLWPRPLLRRPLLPTTLLPRPLLP